MRIQVLIVSVEQLKQLEGRYISRAEILRIFGSAVALLQKRKACMGIEYQCPQQHKAKAICNNDNLTTESGPKCQYSTKNTHGPNYLSSFTLMPRAKTWK